jgi:hypothetical protein
MRDVAVFDNNNNLILEFTDQFKSNNYFIRTIKDTHFHFIDDKLVVNIKDKNIKNFISKINLDQTIN